jgi:tetratricopeptide (TPR) repeat protein
VTEPRRIARSRRALGKQLAAYRKAAGYSQHELAPLTAYGRSTVANVETGRQHVPRAFWQRCDEVLATDGALTTAYDELQALVTQHRRAEARLASQVPRTPDTLGGLPDDDTRDRLAYVAEHPGRADLVAVAQLRERVRQITTAYDTVPSVSLLAAASQVQVQVSSLRAQARDSRVRRELHAVDAEASTLMGQLVWDASQRRDHATSTRHFDHAIAAAQAIRDPVAEAHAVLRKSYIALYGVRQPEAGLALAMQAAKLSSGASHTLAGLSLLHVAEAHGYLRAQHDCEEALDTAQARLALRTDLDVAADFYSPAQFGRLAGSCYLSLALPRKAEHHLSGTVQAMQTRQKVSALVLGNLALALIRQRRLEEATSVVHEAIDEVERTRGGGGLNVIFAAGRELRPWRDEPQVQEVHDRLLALIA